VPGFLIILPTNPFSKINKKHNPYAKTYNKKRKLIWRRSSSEECTSPNDAGKTKQNECSHNTNIIMRLQGAWFYVVLSVHLFHLF
jgi:hypothetical protein